MFNLNTDFMIKNLLVISTFCVLLISCGNNENKSPEPKDNDTTAVTQLDTLIINGLVYKLDSISEAEFNSAPVPLTFEETDNEWIDDSAHVQRLDSLTLQFHLGNGGDSLFVSDSAAVDDTYKSFRYMGSYANIPYWLVGVSYWEGGGIFLLNKNDGHKIHVFGPPMFSPDKKYFISYSLDMYAGYINNGIELYEIKGGKVLEKWSKLVNDWGPDDVRWKNDSLIYIKQFRIGENDKGNQEYFTYRSMKVR